MLQAFERFSRGSQSFKAFQGVSGGFRGFLGDLEDFYVGSRIFSRRFTRLFQGNLKALHAVSEVFHKNCKTLLGVLEFQAV